MLLDLTQFTDTRVGIVMSNILDVYSTIHLLSPLRRTQ